MERVTRKLTRQYVKRAVWLRKLKQGICFNLEGQDGEGDGRKVGKIRWRRDMLPTLVFLGFPCGSAGKEYAHNTGELGSIPGLGRSPGEGRSYILQYSDLEDKTLLHKQIHKCHKKKKKKPLVTSQSLAQCHFSLITFRIYRVKVFQVF